MKKPSHDARSTEQEDRELEELPLDENDPLWQLLKESPHLEAGPFFSRNVMREIRALEAEKPSLWQKIRRARAAWTTTCAIGLAATAALILSLNLSPRSPESTTLAASPSVASTALETYLDEELLRVAADEPSLFSDDEVIAMLF